MISISFAIKHKIMYLPHHPNISHPSPTKWCLLLYPNGNQEDREGFVSLYLYRFVHYVQDVQCVQFGIETTITTTITQFFVRANSLYGLYTVQPYRSQTCLVGCQLVIWLGLVWFGIIGFGMAQWREHWFATRYFLPSKNL